jgi:stage III sporulation protein SpoIIIAA
VSINAQVLVIDEIGSKQEVWAVKSIAQRGVAIVATAHGVRLDSLLKNPELNPLLGGLQQVTLGDIAAKCAHAIHCFSHNVWHHLLRLRL